MQRVGTAIHILIPKNVDCREASIQSLTVRLGSCADRRRPELDSAMRRARRDGQQSMYWTKKLLDFEERDPDR